MKFFSVPEGPVWLSDALSVCGFDIPESEGEKQWENAGEGGWMDVGGQLGLVKEDKSASRQVCT